MPASISPVPPGYGTVTPWLIARDAAGLIDWLAAVFDAVEIARVPNADGAIDHAEVRIGDSVVMLFDARPRWPQTPAFLRLYLPEGDAVLARAAAAGGAVVTEMTDLFFGERVGRVRDPWDNLWWIHTRTADLTPEEVTERAGDPAFAAGMEYVQGTLDAELQAAAVRRAAVSG